MDHSLLLQRAIVTHVWKVRLTGASSVKVRSGSWTQPEKAQSADAKRLVVESSTDQARIYLASLGARGRIEGLRRLTLDERFTIPYAWTPDSNAVIFTSDRTGTFLIYKEALDQDVPELIPTGPESTRMARVSPDGNWLIYAALSNAKSPDQSGSIRLMRVPLAGGPPQLIFESNSSGLNFSCPNRSGAQWIGGEADPDHTEVLFSFDPLSGTRHQLFSSGATGKLHSLARGLPHCDDRT